MKRELEEKEIVFSAMGMCQEEELSERDVLLLKSTEEREKEREEEKEKKPIIDWRTRWKHYKKLLVIKPVNFLLGWARI